MNAPHEIKWQKYNHELQASPLNFAKEVFHREKPARPESGRTDSRSTDIAKGINRGARRDSLMVAVAYKPLTIKEKSANNFSCMNPMPHHANSTMEVARETLAMSEKSGDRSMKVMGMILLAMTGLATMLHAGHAIYRDLFAAKGRKVQKDNDPSPPSTAHQFLGRAAEEGAVESGAPATEGSWVRKARLTERTQAGEHGRPAYRDRHGHAHQR